MGRHSTKGYDCNLACSGIFWHTPEDGDRVTTVGLGHVSRCCLWTVPQGVYCTTFEVWAVAAKEMVSAAALVTPVLVELVVDMLPELLLFNLDGSILFVLEAAVGMLAGTLTPLVLVSVEVVPVG